MVSSFFRAASATSALNSGLYRLRSGFYNVGDKSSLKFFFDLINERSEADKVQQKAPHRVETPKAGDIAYPVEKLPALIVFEGDQIKIFNCVEKEISGYEIPLVRIFPGVLQHGGQPVNFL